MNSKYLLGLLLLVFSLSVPVLGETTEGHEAMIKDFVKAKYSGDFASLKKLSLQKEGLEILVKGVQKPSTDKEKDRFNQFLERVSVRKSSNQKQENILTFQINFGGTIMPIDLVKNGQEWLVDAKWMIAMSEEPTLQHRTAQEFFYSVIAKNALSLWELSLDRKEIHILTAGRRLPGGDLGQYQHLCFNMPMIEIKNGEMYYDLSGKQKKAEIPKGMVLLQGRFGFGSKHMSFFMKEVEGIWKIDAAPFVEMAKPQLSEEEIQESKDTLEEKLLRGRSWRTLNSGTVEELNFLVKKINDKKILDDLLDSAYSNYWMSNQGGELERGSTLIKKVEILIDGGGNIESRDWLDRTLLMQAVKSANGNNRELVELLVAKGADIHATTKDGKTVKDVAGHYYERFRDLLEK